MERGTPAEYGSSSACRASALAEGVPDFFGSGGFDGAVDAGDDATLLVQHEDVRRLSGRGAEVARHVAAVEERSRPVLLRHLLARLALCERSRNEEGEAAGDERSAR